MDAGAGSRFSVSKGHHPAGGQHLQAAALVERSWVPHAELLQGSGSAIDSTSPGRADRTGGIEEIREALEFRQKNMK